MAVNISSQLLKSPPHLDFLTVSITYGKTFIINLLYVPPSVNLSYLSDFESILHTLNSNDHLLLLGDLNFPDVNWSTLTGHTPLSTYFCGLIFEFNLDQLIMEPTHKRGNLLDVILTNTNCIDNISVRTTPPFGLSSDHYLINFSLNFTHEVESFSHPCQSVLDFSHADWDGILTFLETHDFTSYFDSTDVEALWFYLKNLLQQALDHYVPKVTLRSHQQPKWFTLTLQHQLNCLHTLRRKHSKKPSTSCKSKLLDAEHKFQALASAAKYEYENKLINRLSVDKNYSIYKYISSLTKHNIFPTTMYYGSNYGISNSDKAYLFIQSILLLSLYKRFLGYPNNLILY